MDQTDRNAGRLVHCLAEEISCGRKPADGLRRTPLPFSREIRLGRLRAETWHGNQADVRPVGRHPFKVRVLGGYDRHLHIGLPRTDPDLTDEHILEHDPVIAFNDHSGWCPDGEWVECHAPVALRIGGRTLRLAVDGHRDFLARVGPSPDRDCLTSLQYHVAGKQGGQLYIRPSRGQSREAHDQTCKEDLSGQTGR